MIDLDKITQRPSTDVGGPLGPPRFVILHYTASTTLEGAVRELTRKDDRPVSAHFVVGPNGEVVQCVPLHRVAYHAGLSEWQGVKSMNSHAFGIELVNPGYDAAKLDENWPRVLLRHKSETRAREWGVYPHGQIQAVQDLVAALAARYPTLHEVLGHDDVSPGRKLDPGPAWPIKLPCTVPDFVASTLRAP